MAQEILLQLLHHKVTTVAAEPIIQFMVAAVVAVQGLVVAIICLVDQQLVVLEQHHQYLDHL